MSHDNISSRFASALTRWTGSTWGFIAALAIISAWGLSGPHFHYCETWQLVINTITTIVTFVMVFLIQRTQNKESLAMQLKLNEIVAAIEGASNRLISVEDLSERDLAVLHAHYRELADMAKSDLSILQSHSIDEAKARHQRKTSGAPALGMPTAHSFAARAA